MSPSPSLEAAPGVVDETLHLLHHWADAGLLRQLDAAFASFVNDLDEHARPALLISAALLSRMEGMGHSCLSLDHVPRPEQILAAAAWPEEAQHQLDHLWRLLPATPEEWIADLLASPVVHATGRTDDSGQPLVIDGQRDSPRLYLRRYWNYERRVAESLTQRSFAFDPVDEAATRGRLDPLFESSSNHAFAAADAGAAAHPEPAAEPDWQKLACALARRGRLTIITGGPGTGKTYTAARLLALLFATSTDPQHLRIALAAPTGKAAARLRQSIRTAIGSLHSLPQQAIDLVQLEQRLGPARTLHALLGARPDTRRFRHDASDPLNVDVLVVDEASMVHLEMMAALLDALPASARLVLLGDKDQLASVEAGAVLGDLCRDAQAGNYDGETTRYLQATTGIDLPARYLAVRSEAPALSQQTVMLRTSRRFSGPIGALARAVNEASDSTKPGRLLHEDTSGVLFVNENASTEQVVDLVVNGRRGTTATYRNYLEILARGPAGSTAQEHERWVIAILQAFERFRLLCALREGPWGVSGLNRAIVQALAHAGLLAPRGSWYPGRPVIVTRNDHSLGVYNGDVGIALPTETSSSSLRVYFLDGERPRSVAVSRLAEVETAFAMTVHKSQGSEFEHVALALSAHAGNVLTRELVYTGITRARGAFSLLSERAGVLEEAMSRRAQRESGLYDRLGKRTSTT